MVLVLPLTDLLVPLVEGGGRRLPGRATPPPGGPMISPLGVGMHLQGISVARISSCNIVGG